MKPLKVLPRGASLVPVYESLGGSQKRFVGRKYEAVEGQADVQGRWLPLAEPVVVPVCAQGSADYLEMWHAYAKAVRKGDLWAADKATADACGATFDPSFGGEFAAKGDEQ